MSNDFVEKIDQLTVGDILKEYLKKPFKKESTIFKYKVFGVTLEVYIDKNNYGTKIQGIMVNIIKYEDHRDDVLPNYDIQHYHEGMKDKRLKKFKVLHDEGNF